MPEQLLDQAPAVRRRGPSPWTWMIVACALVALSGVVRVNQERLFADAARTAETPPFSLRDLPRSLGGLWTMVGDENELPAETLQIAGCTDYVYRDYVDDSTGVQLRVLVAFGPAIKVFPHSPVVCFPANGFKARGEAKQRDVSFDEPDSDSADGASSPDSAPFRAMTFGRSGGGREELVEVYYSFWHDGLWDPDASQTKRRFQHRPALFKIQVERLINPSEQTKTENSPIEGFLADLVPEINRRIDDWNNTVPLGE